MTDGQTAQKRILIKSGKTNGIKNMGFDYINVYSPFSGEGFTICCGNKFDKLSDAQATPRPLRKYMFADVCTYDFGFAVLNRHGRHHIPKRRGFQPLDTPFQMERGSAWRAETKHTFQLLRH